MTAIDAISAVTVANQRYDGPYRANSSSLADIDGDLHHHAMHTGRRWLTLMKFPLGSGLGKRQFTNRRVADSRHLSLKLPARVSVRDSRRRLSDRDC